MILTIATLAVIAAFGVGYLRGARSAGLETVEKCRAKIETANDKTREAEQSARMWRDEADRLRGRLAQVDRDVTASTTMLLEELDKAAAGECPHGKRSGCDWCDARPTLVMTR